MVGGKAMAAHNTIAPATATAAVPAPSIKLKLLRQHILDSVDDDLVDRVLHKLVFPECGVVCNWGGPIPIVS